MYHLRSSHASGTFVCAGCIFCTHFFAGCAGANYKIGAFC
nr:MAG TPA: hypothetical protein [Caudoviricetes sp.]